jgi:hypothetical protein
MLLRIRVCFLAPLGCSFSRSLCAVPQFHGDLLLYSLATSVLSIIQHYAAILRDQNRLFSPLQRMDARPTNVSGARRRPDVNKINT